MGRTARPIQNNNGLTPLPPVYTFRDDNLFMLNLQDIHTKAVKVDDAEIYTAIWNGAAAELFQGVYMAKRHEPTFQHFRNIKAVRFKRNVDRRFVRYMVEAYGPSRSMWQVEIRKEGERDLEACLEAL